MGFSAHVRSIETEEIADADCVFVTNSLRLASPVHQLDGHDLKRATISGILEAMLKAAHDQCGHDFIRRTP
jgi:branched-subunit amino acid aminotransferase/4-amino-4-deoxychorismate lyase